MEKHRQLQHSGLKKYRQLEILYRISRAIAKFERIEESVPGLMALAAEGLPFRNAVLLESRGAVLTTTTWSTDGVTRKQVSEALHLAKHAYAQLVDISGSIVVPLREKADYFALPLVISGRPTFGILLLQGWTEVDEADLTFADTIANLFAVAVDRYYTTLEVLSVKEKSISDLEEERDLRMNFVSILTHDLRSPLATVKMSAELIARTAASSPECKKRAAQIIGGVTRVDRMIDDLLDANRIRAGERLPLKIEEFELCDLLRKTIDELSVVYKDRIRFTGDQEEYGFWSRDAISRAVQNLVSNAVKYGYPDRPIQVSLKGMGGKVRITVQNEGNPIPSAELASVFEPFKRAKSAEKSSVRGWGLGLALVRGVAEAHGGTAWAESGDGTTFTIELPRDARLFQ